MNAKEFSKTPHGVLSWIFTPPYLVLFGGILCFFHPLQWLALRCGYTPHKYILDLMNRCLIWNFRTVGTRFNVHLSDTLTPGQSYIFVSNHQSMYDIPLIIWFMKKFHPKFIAKQELGRGIPSISFALRNMGSVLIDRKSPPQAITAISEFGKNVATHRWSASIFPEGTRAREGELKNFKSGGLFALLNSMPNAAIVPIVIDGSWKMLRYKLFPLPFGTTVYFHVLEPIVRSEKSNSEILHTVESAIRTRLTEIRARGLKQGR